MKADPEILALIREVEKEIARAVIKFPDWPDDPMHAAGIVGEELGELTQAVLEVTYEPGKSTIQDVRKEAVQVAAMSLRFLRSIDRYNFTPVKQHKQSWGAARDLE